jgi:hypothetical protein
MATKPDIASFNTVIRAIERHLNDLGQLRELLNAGTRPDSDDRRDGRKPGRARSCGTTFASGRPLKPRSANLKMS